MPESMSRVRSDVSLMILRWLGSTPAGRRLAPKKSASLAEGNSIAFSHKLARALRVVVEFTVAAELRHPLAPAWWRATSP